ncbi:hypothetical protein [Nocardioides endophyticus]|uniref:hypothetical protein n=1 Tax=Nocardioides endophyticus TaxID=1353775 RepID=UPI0031ED5F25
MARTSAGADAILATPVHWHGALYEGLLHGKGPTDDFKWRNVFAVLDEHRIGRRADQKAVFAALGAYMEDLHRLGLVKIYRDRQKRVLLFSPTALNIGDVADPAAQQGR